MKKLAGKHILIGISGSIAAYKICDLIRKLKKCEAEILVVVTKNALEFVTETTLKTLSGGPVLKGMFYEDEDEQMMHIKLADWADLFLVAPATANCIGKFASGIADDLLSTTFLTVSGHVPVLVAPAMNTHMYANPIVQKNILTLLDNRIFFVGPAEGELACGDSGKGRLSDLAEIVAAIEKLL